MRSRCHIASLLLALGAGGLVAAPTAVHAQAPVLHERLPAAGDPARGDPFDLERLDDPGEAGALDGPEGATAGRDGPPSGFAVDAVPRLSPPGDVRLDDNTGRDDLLTYFAVFDPSVAPFKRGYVRDRLRPDGALSVADANLRPLPPDRRPGAADRAERTSGTRAGADRELFWGSLLVELADGRPVPIPSVAAGGRVFELETVPSLPVELLVDGADNLYLRSSASGRVRLNMLVDAPPDYFSGPLPEDVTLGETLLATPPGERPALPAAFREAGRAVFAAIRAAHGHPPRPPEEVPLSEALTDLTGHFRAFEPGPLPHVPDDPVDRYRTIALGGRGVCRHRAYAFVVTAQAVGVPARYVANEAHAFVEVRTPGDGGWRRIDLGGGAAGFDVRGAAHRAQYIPDRPDPLPRPPAYARSYSAPPSPAERAAGSAASDFGGGGFGEGRFGGTGGFTAGGTGGTGTLPLAAVVRLDHTVAHVFRGESVSVSGRVETPSGPPPAGRLVEVLLVRPGPTRRGPERIGVVPTDADGHFAADLRVPPALSPGRYRLVGRYLGDRVPAP